MKKYNYYKKRFNEYLENHPFMNDLWNIFLGISLAVLIYSILRIGLGTTDPIVTVVSCSMLPNLDRGDFLILKGVNSINELTPALTQGNKTGDIVVYYEPRTRRLIVHRFIKLKEDGTIMTWGDNNSAPDPWPVKEDQLRGKVLFRIPYIGYPRIIVGEIWMRLNGIRVPEYNCGLFN